MSRSNSDNGDVNLPALPEGWVWTTLGAVSDTTRRRTKIQDGSEVKYIGLEHVEAHTMRLLGTGLAIEITSSTDSFEADDVLYGRMRPYLNKVFRSDFEGRCSPEFIVFRWLPYLESKYLQYFLNSSSFVTFASQLTQGDRPRVKFEQLASHPFPLPPLAEQQRIVAAIEERLSQISDGVTMLQRAQRRLKRYREAVLKAASEGKLVPQDPADEPASELLRHILDERRAKWEADHLAKMQAQGRMILDDDWKKQYVEPTPPETEGLPELPEGWVWAALPQLGELARGKSKHRPRNDARLFDGPYPFIQTGNIRLAKNTLTAYTQTYSEFGLAQSRLWPVGTLCITIAANIAETAILGIDACFPDSVVGFIAYELVCNVRFVEYFIRVAKENLEHYAPATAQKNINLNILEKLAVPLPALAEQQRIVAEVERRLSIVDNIEATIELNLKRTNKLRQTVLRQAFAGKLVPQNPVDEPADVLLQWIAVERAKREAELQVARETEAKQPKPRGAKVKGNKPKERRKLYDVLIEAKTQLTPNELFQRAEYATGDGLIAEAVELFYDELHREIPVRITIIRPNISDIYDVYLEAVRQ